MSKPKWDKLYQVVIVVSGEAFQENLDEAVNKGYRLDSWHHLYDEQTGYGITAVFLKD